METKTTMKNQPQQVKTMHKAEKAARDTRDNKVVWLVSRQNATGEEQSRKV